MEKTCGTCRFGNPAVLCPFGDNFYEYDERTENFTHGCWEERTDTIEQRYEQLEQVAKEMYQVIDEAMTREQYVCNFGDVERMKSSLKALGVEV